MGAHGPFESMEDEIVWCGEHQRPFAACQISDLRAAIKALKPYAAHRDSCDFWDECDCTCGLAALLKEEA